MLTQKKKMIKYVKKTLEDSNQTQEYNQSQSLQKTSVVKPGTYFFRKKVQKFSQLFVCYL